MSSRFYVNNLDTDPVTMDDTQVHHLRNVMRLMVGDRVMLFDGKNSQALAEITVLDRARAEFQLIRRQQISSELDVQITIAMPLPKTDRIRFLVEKLTELGVDQFVPVVTERSEFHPKSASPEKLLRYVIESSKQCGRNQLMEIAAVEKFESYVQSSAPCKARFMGLRGGDELNLKSRPVGRYHVLIGPEGGFTDAEVDLAKSNDFIPISLGPTILRMETAALKFASLLSG